MSDIYIHIGLYKTGTSNLQNNLFVNIPNIHYTRLTGSLLMHIKKPIIFDKLLISNESFTGFPWSEGSMYWNKQYEIAIRNISILFPTAKIIIGFRDHTSMILSLYKQYLQLGGTKNLDNFFNFSNKGILLIEDLFYEDRVTFLQKHFAPENIFIYTQNDLQSNFYQSITCLEKFMNVSLLEYYSKDKSNTNVGVNKIPARILRQLNIINKFLVHFYLPSLNNRFFKSLGITPRQLCQGVLSNFFKEKLDFTEDKKKQIKELYLTDWQFVQKEKST
ncbi:MAG TPA: sulfotransferase domain-containing protein [Saprospiraceae bacterium]|nr:sulfotransferase domain-containing protein [Saprospiraceae bacterium]HMP23666.1 sulfotransferase domain-containing protein [Saprospiraceae bacterium]